MMPTLANDEWLMLYRHQNSLNGYFSYDVFSTGIENADDPDANTYCIIGQVNASDYLLPRGYYSLRLEYGYNDSTKDILEWTVHVIYILLYYKCYS